jgi:HAD superfamily hydrolase (TIGR01484 family)
MPYTRVPGPTAPEPSADVADIRLVVTDMDGTLLDDDKRIPARLWEVLARLRERGVLFSPASGRQYASLAREFADVAEGMVFIAENGAYVVRDGEELSSDPLDPDVVAGVVAAARRLAADGVDMGVVVCGKRSAYVERSDEPFLAEVARYYVRHQVVEDVAAVDDEIVKVALFDFGPAEERTAPALASFADTHQVVVSGEHWVDVMNRTAHKGAALRRLQRELGREDVLPGRAARPLGQRLRVLVGVAHPQPGGQLLRGHVHGAVEVLPQRVEFQGVGHGRPLSRQVGQVTSRSASSPPRTSSAASPARR